MMSDPLSFDKKNADDYRAITQAITTALEEIQADTRIKPSKANLARRSGVHRNTLRLRAQLSTPEPADIEKGWPYSVLKEIADSRRAVETVGETDSRPTDTDRIGQLGKQLEKSRYVASTWFHRSVCLKRERNEARRQVEMLQRRIERLEQAGRERENELSGKPTEKSKMNVVKP